ncbi:hypothetical protein ACFFR3_41200 [Nonomuraea salmonea]|uniref:Uncharacterized protein n=2 Tax=Nonomuraea salmonea TaxID=46181 RepID=A0ABV5P053_9ACTN
MGMTCGADARRPVADEAFTTLAREVADRWQRSPERRPWLEGFVPLKNLTMPPKSRTTPRWASRSELNSVWKLETDLPDETPAPAELHWADGSTLNVPLVTAKAAYAGLTRPRSFVDEECPAKGCRPLRVTAVSRGTAAFPTSRGDVRVPTWDFTVHGVPGRFRRVAVDPAAMGGPPRPVADSVQEIRTYDQKGPAELRLRYLHGTCDTTYGARAHETAEAVVVDVDVRWDEGVTFCNLMGKTDHISVTLREPLGRRVVLDSSSGVPLLPDSAVELSDFRGYDPRQS